MSDTVIQAPPADVEREPDRDERAEQIRAVMGKLEMKHARDGSVQGPRRSLVNLDTIVKDDPWYRRKTKFNGLTEVVEWNGARLTDEDITRIRLAIARTYGVEFTAKDVFEVVVETARQRTYHPVARYLERVLWDGVERIDRYLVDYIGADDNELNRAISRRWFVGAVARAMGRGLRPVKQDNVLVLVGAQGTFKSTSFRALAGAEWFADSALDLRSKDALVNIRGTFLYELAELAATRPRDAETVKAFLSAPTDRYRPPYGRTVVESHRQCVFVGTTNEASWLSDPTGARRFHPVEVGRIDLEAIKRDRDLLWAEAVKLWKGGESWWLTPEEERDLASAQERYRHEDPWQAAIEQWMEDAPHRTRAAGGLRIADILVDVLDMDVDRQGKQHEMRLGGVLQSMGWSKRRRRRGGQRIWCWYPETARWTAGPPDPVVEGNGPASLPDHPF